MNTREQAWRTSRALAEVPPIEIEELVPSDARAVVVAPHPDDEVLGSGGALAALSGLGRRSLVISITDGTASHPRSRALSARSLATLRPAESRRALQVLGTRIQMVRLRLHDGAVTSSVPAFSRRCEALLEPHDVLFSPWHDDGHPDHDVSARVLARLAQRRGLHHVEIPIWAWHRRRIDDHAIPWHRARRLALLTRLLERKAGALRHFRSQRRPLGAREPILTPAFLRHFARPYEIFFV